MENETIGQRIAKTTKKIVKRIILFAVIIGLAVFAFLYWGTYEEGVMAGKVLRIAKKGLIFKTYEGKLNLETFGALKGASPIAESFDFSVDGSDEKLVHELEEVALKGDRVNLKFVKRYAAFPWRGDTKYFVKEIERLK